MSVAHLGKVLLGAGLLLVAAAVTAKPAHALFAGNDVIHLVIKAPFDKLASASNKSEDALPGTLSVAGAAPETLTVEVSPRGVTRRMREVCSFPPLRIAFPDKPQAGSLFEGQKKLKLVTHCRPADKNQQYVLLEYAAYRLYKALTPASFSVRLASIDYVDANGKPLVTRLGFFIEATGDMAKRNGLREFEVPERILVGQLSAAAAARFAMFQYMIGNLDWAMNAGPPGTDCCHNARPIGAKAATSGLVPVPYDFDFAGLVDAPYAVAPKIVPVNSVRDRYYRGFCAHNAEAVAAAAAMLAQRTTLLGVVEAIPQLDAQTRDRAKAYLEGYFKLVADPSAIPGTILKTCI